MKMENNEMTKAYEEMAKALSQLTDVKMKLQEGLGERLRRCKNRLHIKRGKQLNCKEKEI